jgi:hypothetical protein
MGLANDMLALTYGTKDLTAQKAIDAEQVDLITDKIGEVEKGFDSNTESDIVNNVLTQAKPTALEALEIAKGLE